MVPFALCMPLGRFIQTGRCWSWMGHLSFWLMLVMLIYWWKCTYCKEKHRTIFNCWLGDWSRSKCQEDWVYAMFHEQNGGQYHNINIGNKVLRLKMWIISEIWGQPLQIKVAFIKKLRPHWTQGMLAIIWCRIFCLSIENPKIERQIYTTVIFLLCCVAVKLGLSHWQRNVGWGYLRIGCWERCLGLRGMR